MREHRQQSMGKASRSVATAGVCAATRVRQCSVAGSHALVLQARASQPRTLRKIMPASPPAHMSCSRLGTAGYAYASSSSKQTQLPTLRKIMPASMQPSDHMSRL